jgi:hypothetical protein
VVQVLRDLFLALGVGEQQLLPLEVESLNCGGNARCSMELTRKLGLAPKKVIMMQVCKCAGAWFCVWVLRWVWRFLLTPCEPPTSQPCHQLDQYPECAWILV